MNTNTTLIIIASLVVAAGAYWYFFTGEGNEPSLTTSTEENLVQMRFQTLVSELQTISFNTSIFTDPRFMALINLATPIAPETAGRLDPFATIPGVNEK